MPNKTTCSEHAVLVDYIETPVDFLGWLLRTVIESTKVALNIFPEKIVTENIVLDSV